MKPEKKIKWGNAVYAICVGILSSVVSYIVTRPTTLWVLGISFTITTLLNYYIVSRESMRQLTTRIFIFMFKKEP